MHYFSGKGCSESLESMHYCIGILSGGVIPKFSRCSDGVRWFESKGRFRDGSYTPVAGDIIFFDWGNNGTIDHVGIVESVSGGTVNTIEGNRKSVIV